MVAEYMEAEVIRSSISPNFGIKLWYIQCYSFI